MPKKSEHFERTSSMIANEFRPHGACFDSGNSFSETQAWTEYDSHEKDGATGVAFVNVRQEPGGIVVTAYDDGNMIDIEAVFLDSFEKYVAVIDKLFDKDLSDATHLGFSADREVAVFQLNGSTDGWMLDALPEL